MFSLLFLCFSFIYVYLIDLCLNKAIFKKYYKQWKWEEQKGREKKESKREEVSVISPERDGCVCIKEAERRHEDAEQMHRPTSCGLKIAGDLRSAKINR